MVWGFAREAQLFTVWGIPEYEAKRYGGKVKSGNILLSIHTENSDERQRAKEILVKGGAEDISYTEESSVRTKNPPIFKVFQPDESLFHF